MAKKKSKYLLDPKHPLRTLVYILIALGFLVGGYFTLKATQTSTESRSKAVETEIVVDSWEFNGTTKEGWVQTNLTSGSVKNGTLYFGVMSANKPSSVTQNTVDGPFANIILQKLKFSLKVNDPPSKLRPSPTPSGRPFTGEVRYMTAGKTTWEAPQPFNGVIDNQFKTYEVLLAGLPDVDITKIQITFKLLPNSTGLTFDWIKLTGQPKPTPTPNLKFGKALDYMRSTSDNNDSKIYYPSSKAVNLTGDFTIEAWLYLSAFKEGRRQYIFRKDGYPSNVEIDLSVSNDDKLAYATFYMWEKPRPSQWITRKKPISINTWHHIAGVRERDKVLLFFDGELANGNNADSTPFENNELQPISIGKIGITHGQPTSIPANIGGLIDELRISNIARYSKGFVPPSTPFLPDNNTLGLWHFDGDTVDSSGRNPNGQIIGNIKFVDSYLPNPQPTP